MEKLLIVEDERLIRQGLKTIASRAPITIDEILECKNGEEAYELLQTTHVDAIFTDIRMPKMDGLALISKLQELPDKPEIVVISGYDDFNYAVESMRYGARDYVLKPVERQRVYDILVKLDHIISKKKDQEEKQTKVDKIAQKQLKYILINPIVTDDELSMFQSAFNDLLICNSYVVLCLNKKIDTSYEDVVIQLESIVPFYVLVIKESEYKKFIEQHLSEDYIGISKPQTELEQFRMGYEQAVKARKYAFFRNKRSVEFDQVFYATESYARQSDPEYLARLIGTKEYIKLVNTLNDLFVYTSRSKLNPETFEIFISKLINTICESFSGLIDTNSTEIDHLRSIYYYDTVSHFRLALLEWMDHLQAKIAMKQEGCHCKEQIQVAIDYINKNYASNMNMAVVSNYISMNYSVFSKLFKEFSGKSFVCYLREIRIQKAKELLVNSDLKVTQISRKVGYENDKHFMKAFKFEVGISPSDYRKVEQVKAITKEKDS